MENFLKNIINNISDIPALLSSNNNDKNIKYDYIKNQKYYDYNEIVDELKKTKKRNIFDRKEFVKNNIEEIKEKNDINERYIFILKLLINDNTNQKLINKYLEYLAENKNILEEKYNNNFEKYSDELDFYLNIINVDDAFKLFKINKMTHKSELISLMNNLLKYNKDNINEFENIDNINEFENYLKSFEDFDKSVIYYNMPSDPDNEDLCYYGFLNLLKYSLKNLYKYIMKKKLY